MRRIVQSVAAAAGIPIAVASLVGFAGSAWWVLDLFAHFRVQYAVALAACAALALAARGRAVAAGLAAFALLNAALVAPLYVPGGGGDDVAAGSAPHAVRIAHVNVLTSNPQKDALTRWIAASGADAVIAMEVNGRWARALEKTPGYRVVLAQPRGDNFGMMLLASTSGAPVADAALAAEIDLPAIEATVGGIRVLGLHTLPPISGEYSTRRDRMIEGAAAWVANQRGPAAVMGDYNATPWSAPFRRFVRATGFRNSQRGFGVQASWPMVRAPFAPLLRIPIDHLTHSPDLAVTRRALGPANGSDHRPLVVDLAGPLPGR